MSFLVFLMLALVHPESAICVNNRIFVSDIGRFGVKGDGKIVEITKSGESVYVEGLDDPKGLAYFKGVFYVADVTRVLKVENSKVEIYAEVKDFPVHPEFLNDVIVDSSGNVYISDTQTGYIFKILPSRKIEVVAKIDKPNGLAIKADTLFVITFERPAKLYAIVKGKKPLLIHTFKNVKGGDGLIVGKAFKIVSGYLSGTIIKLKAKKEEVLYLNLKTPADINICGEKLLVPLLEKGDFKVLPIK